MNILCVMPWYPANAPVFLAEAFKQIGCYVTRIGPKYFDQMGLEWPEAELPKVHLELPREAPCWNLDSCVDMATQAGYPPDLLYVSEENYRTEIVPTSKVPVILWSQDGWPDNYVRRELFQPTVAYCNQPRGNRFHPLEADMEGWRLMPGAAAPWIHRNMRLYRTDDFCLFATMYGQRQRICGGLTRRGFLVLSGQRSLLPYVLGYNRALCTLHNPGHWEVKWRFFEAAAMGCVNISDHTPLLDRLGYTAYEHYFPISAPPDGTGDPWPDVGALANVIAEMRAKQLFWQSISARAHARVLTHDTYYHRVQRIAHDLGLKSLGEMAEQAIGKMLAENNARRESIFNQEEII